METFRSKVDGWFVAVAVLTGVVGGVGVVAAARGGYLLAGLVPLLGMGLVMWVWASTRYVISERDLVVRSAFVGTTVPLASITHVRRTATLLSAPALSLDRLEIQHASGTVVISPFERERFVRSLVARNPLVKVEAFDGGGDAVLRQARRVALVAVAVSIAGVLFALVALTR